ncbi:deoxynucleotidyltransferase terminal-interacting protein 1-like [Dendronephthya gigantea]|uniref:deoxynucleotidyltransferase terminal-interacting protein 1-like n=1 Tax=Dendronephthya gigantea TaxID=151771 RepID=UPI001069FB7D|nr:deoxynucleotidyltransferase terminal-interacting protein 1-like [Dendronephthya gigantea]
MALQRDEMSKFNIPISSQNIENQFLQEDRKPKKSSREVEIQTDVSTPANPFNMTARNFPKRHRNYFRASASNRTRASSFSPGKALDLVRAALQPSLNAELENVLKNYQELLKLAAVNIRDNTGEVVTDELVNTTIRKALDEAKVLFRTDNKPLNEKPERESRTGSPFVRKKRRPRETKDDGAPATKSARSDKNAHYEWDPECINYDTEFVMGVKANKALGFAATRGKLYSRHPDLFKYVGDQEDKQWLYENGHLPITGGKACLMIKDNIYDLLNRDDYKNSENTSIEDIPGFRVSKRMVDKMKAVMRKSQLNREKEVKVEPSTQYVEKTADAPPGPVESEVVTSTSYASRPAQPGLDEPNANP